MFYNNISTVLTIVPIFQFSSKMIWFMNWTKTNSAAAAAKPFSSKPSNNSVNVLLYQSCSPGAAISYTDMLLYHCLIFFCSQHIVFHENLYETLWITANYVTFRRNLLAWGIPTQCWTEKIEMTEPVIKC